MKKTYFGRSASLTLWMIIGLFVSVTYGQPAIIQDKEGYTNVRKGPSSKTDIVHKLVENEVFYALLDREDESWVSVSFQGKGGKMTSGYVHRSRILPLSRLKQYKGKELKFQYVVQPFDVKAHTIKKGENGGVIAIDGRPIWGTDGGLPTRETTAVNVTFNGKRLAIGESNYVNLFEVSNEFTQYKKDGYYFLEQGNSDGAGAYQVVWVFNSKGLQQLWVYD